VIVVGLAVKVTTGGDTGVPGLVGVVGVLGVDGVDGVFATGVDVGFSVGVLCTVVSPVVGSVVVIMVSSVSGSTVFITSFPSTIDTCALSSFDFVSRFKTDSGTTKPTTNMGSRTLSEPIIAIFTISLSFMTLKTPLNGFCY
jgi:hypothetical protein